MSVYLFWFSCPGLGCSMPCGPGSHWRYQQVSLCPEIGRIRRFISPIPSERNELFLREIGQFGAPRFALGHGGSRHRCLKASSALEEGLPKTGASSRAKKALVAIGRKLLIAVWHILTEGAFDKHAVPEKVAATLFAYAYRVGVKNLPDGMSARSIPGTIWTGWVSGRT